MFGRAQDDLVGDESKKTRRLTIFNSALSIASIRVFLFLPFLHASHFLLFAFAPSSFSREATINNDSTAQFAAFIS